MSSKRLALYAFILVTSACGERIYEYYGAMVIDPATLHVRLIDTIGVDHGKARRFYLRFTDARRRPGITYGEADRFGRTVACFDNLELDSTYTLSYRSKSQELWRGEFGLVLGQTSYYYADEYREQGTGFVTVPNANRDCVEHPALLSEPPDTAGLRLDAISVVRVFAGDSSYAVVAGNYSPAGVLQSISHGRVPRRASTSPDDARAIDVRTEFVRQPPDVAQVYGFRTAFDPRSRNVGVATRADSATPYRELVSFHFNRGGLVRQHGDSGGVSLATRWLRFAPSYADTVLITIDSTKSFGLTTWLRKD